MAAMGAIIEMWSGLVVELGDMSHNHLAELRVRMPGSNHSFEKWTTYGAEQCSQKKHLVKREPRILGSALSRA